MQGLNTVRALISWLEEAAHSEDPARQRGNLMDAAVLLSGLVRARGELARLRGVTNDPQLEAEKQAAGAVRIHLGLLERLMWEPSAVPSPAGSSPSSASAARAQAPEAGAPRSIEEACQRWRTVLAQIAEPGGLQAFAAGRLAEASRVPASRLARPGAKVEDSPAQRQRQYTQYQGHILVAPPPPSAVCIGSSSNLGSASGMMMLGSGTIPPFAHGYVHCRSLSPPPVAARRFPSPPVAAPRVWPAQNLSPPRARVQMYSAMPQASVQSAGASMSSVSAASTAGYPGLSCMQAPGSLGPATPMTGSGVVRLVSSGSVWPGGSGPGAADRTATTPIPQRAVLRTAAAPAAPIGCAYGGSAGCGSAYCGSASVGSASMMGIPTSQVVRSISSPTAGWPSAAATGSTGPWAPALERSHSLQEGDVTLGFSSRTDDDGTLPDGVSTPGGWSVPEGVSTSGGAGRGGWLDHRFPTSLLALGCVAAPGNATPGNATPLPGNATPLAGDAYHRELMMAESVPISARSSAMPTARSDDENDPLSSASFEWFGI